MRRIDLKPLNKETIQKMGIENHDLWVVKVNGIIHGPFETESLKHYASENESLFDNAVACRLENNDWQPFFSHAIFQRRHPQVINKLDDSSYEGPFWIMAQGLKSAPKSKDEIFKMIEMGLLAMTDLISCDDGIHWKKLHQMTLFDRRGHKPAELPQSPQENSFQKAKLDLLEQEYAGQTLEEAHPEEGVASLAFLSQEKTSTIKIKIDEITLASVQETEVSRSLKWAIPTAVAGCIALVVTGIYVFSPSHEMEEAIVENEEVVPKYGKSNPQTEKIIPANVQRAPASDGSLFNTGKPSPNRAHIQHNSKFPTHIETHHYDANQPEPEPEPEQEPEQLERDPANEPVENGDMDRNPADQEHSLVNHNKNQNENQNQDMSLNEAMNVDNVQPPEPPQEQPPVEEVSDF